MIEDSPLLINTNFDIDGNTPSLAGIAVAERDGFEDLISETKDSSKSPVNNESPLLPEAHKTQT